MKVKTGLEEGLIWALILCLVNRSEFLVTSVSRVGLG